MVDVDEVELVIHEVVDEMVESVPDVFFVFDDFWVCRFSRSFVSSVIALKVYVTRSPVDDYLSSTLAESCDRDVDFCDNFGIDDVEVRGDDGQWGSLRVGADEDSF